MPNSTWTETVGSISLVPVTTPIDPGSSPSNVNYLTNSDKIHLMLQYNAELATQAQLDSTASNLSIATTNYDDAVATINTTLVNAGAPSNWATIWPDGTVFGPSTGIQTNLASDWKGIATARTTLQNDISATQASTQAAAAQSAAISAAATDATNKMNDAITTAENAAPTVVNGLPTMPNSAYPSGRMVWDTTTNQMYVSAGSSWTSLAVPAPNITGTLAAAQIASLAASQVTGQLTAAQIASLSTDQLTAGTQTAVPYRVAIPGEGSTASTWMNLGTWVFASAGSLKIEVHAGAGYNTNNNQQAIVDVIVRTSNGGGAPNISGVSVFTQGGTTPVLQAAAVATGGSTAAGNNSWEIMLNLADYANGFALIYLNDGDTFTYSGAINQTAPVAGTTAVLSNLGTLLADHNSNVQNLGGVAAGSLVNPAAAGTGLDFVLDGTTYGKLKLSWLSSGDIAAGVITATQIAANTITSAQIAAETITAAQIAAGTITTSQIAAGTIQASNIASATITGGNIAANTIETGNIAAGAITANQIASGTITAGQIAAGAIGATQLAAQSITADKLTLTDFTNICSNGSGATGAQGWPGSISSISNYSVAGVDSILIDSDRDAYFGLPFPVTAGETYYFSAWCCPGNVAVSGSAAPAGALTFGLHFGSDSAFDTQTWTGATPYAPTTNTGWEQVSGQVTVPSGYNVAEIWVQINATAGSTGTWAFTALTVRKAASAELLVDGSITANMIAAGAITADMITTGTLNAANVNVTNLNASNITAGTLAANMVVFSDGTDLTTASRVSTVVYNQTANVLVTGASTPGSALTGLSFSSPCSGTTDVFNLFGHMLCGQESGSAGDECYISLYIDGTFNQQIILGFEVVNSLIQTSKSFFMSVTGLASGSHTFTFYIQGSLSTDQFFANTGSSILLQRTY